MSLGTYDDLKDEIASHLERDDLTAQIDTFIDLAEARHKRDVRIRNMVSRETISVNDRYINLPDGFIEPIALRLITDPVTVLDEINHYEMTRQRMGNGKPRFFCLHGMEIEFDKSPDSAYSGEITFYKELTALSDSNTSNAILARAPDLYLYGALISAEPFLMNDARIQTWAALYQSAVDSLKAMDRKRTGPLVSRVVGATP